MLDFAGVSLKVVNQPPKHPDLCFSKSKVPFLTLHFKAIHVVALEGSDEGDCQIESSPNILMQTWQQKSPIVGVEYHVADRSYRYLYILLYT